jgi:hypothetical protein
MKKISEVESRIIQTIHATPKRIDGNEPGLFESFKKFFIPRLRKQEEIALKFEEALVRKTEAEGEKLIEEAAKISAEKDIAKQSEIRAYIENVDAIFNDSSSKQAAMLKLAKLLEANPEIETQLQKVNDLINTLSAKNVRG